MTLTVDAKLGLESHEVLSDFFLNFIQTRAINLPDYFDVPEEMQIAPNLTLLKLRPLINSPNSIKLFERSKA